jgi:ribonucleoside-diphosphate reductase alpha chain
MASWKLMIKANALYRDGSKLSQPLSSVSENIFESLEESEVEELVSAPAALKAQQVAEKIVEKLLSVKWQNAAVCRAAAQAIRRKR